uniref:Uncharacterized protein n=1 Tax=Tanacetum cinerariifolium TaxID=118510 RepID=A0A6L2KR99_TANCI|nr:hypothetical protein [Tanacetum cinerariifolium]
MANVQTTQAIEDTHVTLTPVNLEGQQQSSSVSSRFVSNMLNPSPDTGIDSIFNLNTESKLRVDIPVTTTAEPPLVFATTLPPPSTPIIPTLKQTPIPSPANVPSSSLQDLPNFGSLFRRRDNEDKDEEPSVGSNQGSKRRRARKEPESTSAPKEKTSKTTGKSNEGSKSHHKSASEAALAEEPMHTTKYLKEPAHQELDTGATDDQPVEEASQHPDCNLARKYDSRTSFNELMDTPLEFSAFVMNRLKVNTLTPELLSGLTYELMKGSCKILVELEFFLEEVYKATTDQLDWNNPEGQQYPHDLRKPLPLIPTSWGRRVIPFDHFINKDLDYLRGGVSSRKYTTSVMKTKAADYAYIKWIKDLIVMDNPNSPNEPNEDIPEENPVILDPNHVEDAHDPNEMVDILDDEDLVDHDGDDEEPEEEPADFPYEMEGDQTPPPRDESSDFEPPRDESSDSVSSDSDLKDEEANIAPEATARTVAQRPFAIRDFLKGIVKVGESSAAHDSSYVGGLAPWALRHDLETSHALARLTEAELSTIQAEIALLKSKNKIGEKERKLLDHDLGDVERTLNIVLERLKVLESRVDTYSSGQMAVPG